jgi:putative DNA primase/helicase
VLEQTFILDCLNEDELGDAKLLQRLYDGKMVYSYADKSWFMWGGHSWYEDRTDLILRLVAGQLPRQYLATAGELSPEVKTQKLTDLLIKRSYQLRTLKRVNSVLGFAKGILGITGEEWDKNPWLLAVANGVIDLQQGKLRPGQPGDYIRTVSPTIWRGINEPAPRFEQFIGEIFDNNQQIGAFVQRLLGYGITGLVIEHIFPVLWGEKGRNGKDTLLETLKRVLGPLADTVSTDVLLATNSKGNAQPHIVDLKGKRLVWASETEMNARLNAAQVKLITGGGTIKTRQLYSRMIEFQPTHMIMLITNHKPKAHARDDALWNRMLLLPFTLRFVTNPAAPDERQRDPHLLQKLAEERSGILAWLVRGCLDWQTHGLQIPDLVRASTEDYRKEEDIIGQFIEECCVIAEHASVKASELYTVYREWAEAGGLNPLNQMNFGKDIGKRFDRRRTGYYFVYSGIGLRDTEHDPMIPMIPFSEKSTHEDGNMEKLSQNGIKGIMGSCPPLGRAEDGAQPGQGAAGRAIPLQGAGKPNVNDERRDLITQARALLNDVGTASELATVDVSGRSVQELRWLIGQLEQRRTS